MRHPLKRASRHWLEVTLLASLGCGLALLLGEGAGASSNSPDRSIVLGDGEPGSLYAVTIAVKDPAQIPSQEAFQISIADGQGVVARNGCTRKTSFCI